MFAPIKTPEDIALFLDKTNSLHDGYVLDVRYTHNGITKLEHGHYFEQEKTKLTVRILVTSIWDTVVEIEFEDIWDWQYKHRQLDITDTSVWFDEQKRIVWTDSNCADTVKTKEGSYVIASSMKWRIVK